MKACPFENETCRHFTTAIGCRSDVHHTLWPRKAYKTPLEKKARLASTIVLPRCLHDIEHTYQPPEKPSRDELRASLGAIAIPKPREAYEQPVQDL